MECRDDRVELLAAFACLPRRAGLSIAGRYVMTQPIIDAHSFSSPFTPFRVLCNATSTLPCVADMHWPWYVCAGTTKESSAKDTSSGHPRSVSSLSSRRCPSMMLQTMTMYDNHTTLRPGITDLCTVQRAQVTVSRRGKSMTMKRL